jgi:3-dehydroquinate synthase
VAIGGGVVSDLAGYVAATWMRGIRFVIFPTTLEADVDAAIGGKTAVNLPQGKNLVGAFHQPTFVGIDPECLRTLPARDLRAGLAESVKHALLRSVDFLAWHESRIDDILSLDGETLVELIRTNVQIKGDIVQRDAQERGNLRVLLNLGHTVGHAIESCCAYRLRHGECVSLGMVAACRIARAVGLLDEGTVSRVTTLLSRIGLPIELPERLDVGGVFDVMRSDKKILGGKVRLVLLEAVGRPVVRDDIPETVVREAFESLLS